MTPSFKKKKKKLLNIFLIFYLKLIKINFKIFIIIEFFFLMRITSLHKNNKILKFKFIFKRKPINFIRIIIIFFFYYKKKDFNIKKIKFV
jgi:hypothetical protein